MRNGCCEARLSVGRYRWIPIGNKYQSNSSIDLFISLNAV